MSDKTKELQATFNRLRELGAGAQPDAKRLGSGSSTEPKTVAARLEGLLGGEQSSAKLLISGKVEEAAQLETQQSIVEVYVVADRTASMFYIITEVRDAINEIGNQLFRQGANTKIAICGLEDHYGQMHLGVDVAPLVNTMEALRGQVSELQPASPNGDCIENYECAWKKVAEAIASSPQQKGQKVKRAIVTFMETAAHGQLAEMIRDPKYKLSEDARSRAYSEHDMGCPYNVDWKQALASAKALANHWFLVDCEGGDGSLPHFQAAKRACVTEGRENEHYVALGNSRNLIPALLCAMVEKARGPASYQTYVQKMQDENPTAAVQIAGLLGPCTQVQRR